VAAGADEGGIMKRYIVGAALVALVFAGTAVAASWHWSESYAGNVVKVKVRVPCTMVFSPNDADWPRWDPGEPACNLAVAKRNLGKAQAEAKQQCQAALQAGATECVAPDQNVEVEQKIIDVIKHGLRVTGSDCTGTGLPDKSGYRFTAFRCKIAAYWDVADVTAHGRIVVWVTGRTSLRWKLI